MIEIMSKKTGIDSNSFYGNPSNVKKNHRKTKHVISDENQIPDKKKSLIVCSKENIVRTPPQNGRSYDQGDSTTKFYSNLQVQINSDELNNITNGFNKKSLSSSKPTINRLKGLKGGRTSIPNESKPINRNNIKVSMKSVNAERTPPFDSCLNSLDNRIEMKDKEKITHYFSNKQKTIDFENNDRTDDQNINTNNSEVNSPMALTSTVSNLDECQTPKSWKNTCNESLNQSQVNYCLFNDFNENIIESEDNIFIDWPENELSANTPVGLKNLGNTCYMNSIVQSLFALKFFIEDLEIKFNELNTICEQMSDFSMTQNVLNLYNQYNGLRNRIDGHSFEQLDSDLSNLKQCVGRKSSPFLSGCQQDAAEFFNYIIDSIAEEFECFQHSEPKKNPISRNFSFETGGSLVCQKCENTTQIPNERFNALYLSLPDDKSLQTAFDDFLKDETTGHQCSRCAANHNILSKHFAKRSKVLFLQLARYTQDGLKRNEQVLVPQVIHVTVKSESSQTMIAPSPLATPYRTKLQNVCHSNKMAKVVRKITFDNSFNDENNENLSKDYENDFQIDKNENNLNNTSDNICSQFENSQQIEEKSETKFIKDSIEAKYQLVAVVCHHGACLSVGHYTSFVYSIENSQWFECDDNRITKTNFEFVEKNCQTSGYCYFYALS